MDQTRIDEIVQKTRKDYNAIAEHFSSTRVRPWNEMRQFAEYVQPGQTVLDLGCGNGRLLDALPTPLNYVGVDLSEALIEQARSKFVDHSSQPQFTVGDMRDLPFDDASFHHVFVISSLYHIPSRIERQRVMNEVARVLKPGGYVFMTNWDLRKIGFARAMLRSIPSWFLRRLGTWDFYYRWKTPQGETVAHRYAHAFSLREIDRLFRVADLTTLKQWKTRGGFFNRSRASNVVSIAQKITRGEAPSPSPIPEQVPSV